jgi:hypothetical protein
MQKETEVTLSWLAQWLSGLAPSSLAQWVGAFATSAAVIVALFRDEITRLWKHPQLAIRVMLEPPDCVKTQASVTAPGNVTWTGDTYMFRLWISNTGNQRAEKVQAFVSDVLKQQQPNGPFKSMPGFLPMNLRWSHSYPAPEIYADGIAPGMGKHCDLASISDPSNPTLKPLAGVSAGQVTLDL